MQRFKVFGGFLKTKNCDYSIKKNLTDFYFPACLNENITLQKPIFLSLKILDLFFKIRFVWFHVQRRALHVLTSEREENKVQKKFYPFALFTIVKILLKLDPQNWELGRWHLCNLSTFDVLIKQVVLQVDCKSTYYVKWDCYVSCSLNYLKS